MLGKEKERPRFRLCRWTLLGVRRMDRVLNTRIRELCGVKKVLDEEIGEGVPRWFTHVERGERGMIAKRFYVGGHGRERLIP